MKKTYIRPGIGVEELKLESPLLGESLTKQVTNVTGSGISYGGGGSGSARAGENHLWNDEDDDTDWDQL